jgi:hypothetical protein
MERRLGKDRAQMGGDINKKFTKALFKKERISMKNIDIVSTEPKCYNL